ncbi:hypothetical protein [Silvimonas iriomotensis]|uniref:Uncharacterized protein n=1 Tax=Silvimonas iriomotensis TaxID=449662 RepID=A0ABQ2P4X6_9NEIS|nr:hypothetical protein [Silvimonas iriomotensis]GGP18428.1 hypothetical protein GCM10010970_04940 [Silvimonas iriomotensis]
MTTKRTLLALLLAASAWAAHAADVTIEPADDAQDAAAPADASAKLPLPKTIYRGRVGEAPVQVVFGFLGDHASDEVGLFDYSKLTLTQRASGKNLQHAEIDVTMNGALEASRSALRYHLVLDYADKTWFISAARQDWQCTGGKGWTQRPCKTAAPKPEEQSAQ